MASENGPGVQSSMHEANRGRNGREERAQRADAASTLGDAAEQPTSKAKQTVLLQDMGRLRPGLRAPSSREGVPEVQESRQADQGELEERALGKGCRRVERRSERPCGSR